MSGSLRINSGYVFTFLFFLGRRRSVCFSASVGDTFLGFATELSDFQQRGVSLQASPPDSEKSWLSVVGKSNPQPDVELACFECRL